jgi:SAM-dependent methyltransferase
MEQRFTFDRIAELYDAARPDYPEALFADIAAVAALARDDAVLEIGCGTGRATQDLAHFGAPILALDPGPALLDVARARLADFANVRFTEATFEAWPLAPAAFKLVAAAQSWHWVAPQLRFVKAAAALKAGGFLAVFGNVSMPLKAPLGPALDRLYARYAPRLLESAPGDWYLPGGVVTKLFADSELFGPATHKAYPWTRQHDSADYVALLRTRSDCQMLDPAARDALTAAVAETIEAHGGAFEAGYEAHLYLARRRE